MQYIHRFFTLPETSAFIFGPRGTGKSSFLAQALPNALRIDLLQPETLRLYSAYPERLASVIQGSNQKDIVIDEVQKVPELLGVVHSLIEQHQGWRLILTGSSSRKLKRTGVNLLGGRAVLRNFHPFMAAELGNDFSLTQALQLGLIPLVTTSPNPSAILQAYAGLYLREEVQAEGLVRNIGNFSRFLEVMSFSHGSLLNLNNIARECLVSRKLVVGYLEILEDLLLCYLLPVFTKRAQRATVAHQKFYYFDAGVFHSLRHQGPLDNMNEMDGAALEGLVLQHLHAWNDYRETPYHLYYWRTRSGVEVDFILYGSQGFWAIEVKNNRNIHPQDIHHLEAFGQDYPEATLLLLYRGNERMKIKNVLCIPVESFLRELSPEKTSLNLG